LKIPFQAVRALTKQLAVDAEDAVDEDAYSSDTSQAPPVVAKVNATPTGGRLLLVDGFTITAADTPANQEAYPQNPAQEEGLGFPILRCVSVVSLTTGLLVDLAMGPYSGKESGETALLWQLLNELRPGDILIADCYYCTYWLVAACLARGVKIVMKNHDKRDDHPAEGVTGVPPFSMRA
jgi:hypothetical protein